MQTWLPAYVAGDPLASYRESARVLDDKRLRAQANEAKVILRVASGFTIDDNYQWVPWTGRGWANVALTRAWRPWTFSLALYGRCVATEMRERGMVPADVLDGWFRRMAAHLWSGQWPMAPSWLGGPVHGRCRAQLLAKDPEWYGRYGWTEDPADMRIWDDLTEVAA